MKDGAKSGPLRVAHVLARLDCNDGVASHVELLTSQLSRHGVELSVITGLTTGETVAADRYRTLRELVPDWHKIDDAQLKLRAPVLRRLAGILRHGGFDLVHLHGLGLLPIVSPVLLGLGIPVAATYHPSAHGNAAGDFSLTFTPRERFAYRLFLDVFRPDRLIALSKDTDRLFTEDCGINRRRVARIIGGIDTNYFRPPTAAERAAARAAVGVDDDTLVCVLPGRLNLNKGHDVAIPAFAQLGRDHPDRRFLCLFPGAGAQEAEIRALIADSGNPGIFRMPGFVPDMRDVYWASDVAILPSRKEGFALVIAEAMACGCVPVRTPSGGISDQIIEGETGFTVAFNDPAQLADRVGRLLDPGTLAAMRARATAHAHSLFSGERMGDEILALYRQLVSRPGRSRVARAVRPGLDTPS